MKSFRGVLKQACYFIHSNFKQQSGHIDFEHVYNPFHSFQTGQTAGAHSNQTTRGIFPAAFNHLAAEQIVFSSLHFLSA